MGDFLPFKTCQRKHKNIINLKKKKSEEVIGLLVTHTCLTVLMGRREAKHIRLAGVGCNISNTKDRVWPHFQTPRIELKIRRTAEYF